MEDGCTAMSSNSIILRQASVVQSQLCFCIVLERLVTIHNLYFQGGFSNQSVIILVISEERSCAVSLVSNHL
jgi:hypothetical protein